MPLRIPLGLALVVVQCVAAFLASCSAQPGPASQVGVRQQQAGEQRGPTKTLIVGVSSAVTAMSIAADSTTSGGWHLIPELHSNGLVTADANSPKPVGRLAERVPSVDDGTLAILPDGRMRAIYRLRRDVTWHDGVPFTAQDMVFSYQLGADRGLPAIDRRSMDEIESVEAPDDATFIMYFRGPYYLADSLWVRVFWPHPQHVLQEAYGRYQSTGQASEFLGLPYWTSEYVHTGPFRLTRLDPTEGITFEAYDRYFLGRPRVDVIRVRTFAEKSVLFTNLLAGAVDLFARAALDDNLEVQLKSRWEESGAGTVHILPGGQRNLIPQFRSEFQAEPANLDPKVRAALYRAIDREALAETMVFGHRELAAYSVVPPGGPHYEAVRDGLRQFGYDPARARVLLGEAGWVAGPDGLLRYSLDGRRYRTTLWSTGGDENAIIADYWRRLGLEVEEKQLRGLEARDREFRSKYPGWESTTGDVLLRLKAPVASTENGWSGARSGYLDPRADRLVDAYSRAITERAQVQAMQAISDFMAAELPYLTLYFDSTGVGARKGVRAFDDLGGADGPGSYARNAHLWDVD